MPEEEKVVDKETLEEIKTVVENYEAEGGDISMYPKVLKLIKNPEEESATELLLHNAVNSLGSPGLVVNADIAKATPCRCYKIDETEMCFSKGIIGTMSRPQVEAYCPTKTFLTEGIARRVKLFKEAATEAKKKIAGIPKGERLEPWLKEMSVELRKRGIKI